MSKTIYREKLNGHARAAHIEYFGEHLSRNEREAFDNATAIPSALNPIITKTTTDALALGIAALESDIAAGTAVNAVSADDIILTFTDGSADGEYFEFGDDLYEIDTVTVVTDENITVPGFVGGSAELLHIPIEGSVVVTDSGGTITYTEDLDYSLDYVTNEITCLTFTPAVTILVDYNWRDSGTAQTGAIPVLLEAGSVSKESAAIAFKIALDASGTEDWTTVNNLDGTVTLSAATAGVINNGITTDDTNAAHATWDTATSANGVDGTVGDAGALLVDATNLYVASAANTTADANWKTFPYTTTYPINIGTPVNAVIASGILTFTDAASDGDVITVGTQVYEFDDDDSITEGNIQISIATAAAKATETLTASANFTDGETVTIGTSVYNMVTEVDLFTPEDYEVEIQSSLTDSLRYLRAAINAEGGIYSSSYAILGAHADVTCTGSDATTLDLEAKVAGTAGNSIATTEACSDAEFGDTTMSGGAAESSADADGCVTLVVSAINDNTTSDITASDGAGSTVDIVADVAGVSANSIVTLATSATCSFAETALTGGVDGTIGEAGATYVDDTNFYITHLINTIAGANWKKLELQSI